MSHNFSSFIFPFYLFLRCLRFAYRCFCLLCIYFANFFSTRSFWSGREKQEKPTENINAHSISYLVLKYRMLPLVSIATKHLITEDVFLSLLLHSWNGNNCFFIPRKLIGMEGTAVRTCATEWIIVDESLAFMITPTLSISISSQSTCWLFFLPLFVHIASITFYLPSKFCRKWFEYEDWVQFDGNTVTHTSAAAASKLKHNMLVLSLLSVVTWHRID